MKNFVCSICGESSYYDGRCGDGPILICGCDKGQFINDGRGGYYDNPTNAQAVESDNYSNYDTSHIINDRKYNNSSSLSEKDKATLKRALAIVNKLRNV
jgi:hypothetical protein